MKNYRRSRKDYPKGVLGIYDNGGKTFDRYTVVYTPELLPPSISPDSRYPTGYTFPYVGMSVSPFSPSGFGQHGELGFRYTRQPGEKTINFADLPQECQRLVLQDLAPQTGEKGK